MPASIYPEHDTVNLDHIDHVAITVRDLQRSMQWYRDVLGLERRYEDAWGGEPPWMTCAGDTCVALFPAEGEIREAPAPPESIAMRHFAFRIDRPGFEEARLDLTQRGLEPRFEDHGVSHSLYIADPDGHRIEITTYDVPA